MPKKTKQEPVNEWGKVFQKLAAELGVYEAWRSWIYVTGAKLAYISGNNVEHLQNECEHILERLNPDQKKLIDELNRIMGEELEQNPFQDFIGQRYMEIELGEGKSKAQFFTPDSIARLTAELGFDLDNARKEIEEKGFFSLEDCCVGAASLPIAVIGKAVRSGIDPASQIWVSAMDASEIAVLQGYIQLSLLGVAGVICKGDTLLYKFDYCLYTYAAQAPGWIKRKLAGLLSNPYEAQVWIEKQRRKEETDENPSSV